MLKKLFQSFRSPLRRAAHKRSTPEVLNSNQHPLRRGEISRYALSVVDRLQQAGYQAYLVGGCVRDLLLNLEPKDFDVATSATPEQVRAEFRNARVIGRRFKLVHVHFGREIIEVATFRANHPQGDEDEDSNLSSRNESGRILRDNVYGSLEDDAQRRDFTINALYLDASCERILDYANGVHDIRNRLIRLIGDPEKRYQEDPVRMLRAVRFAAKLDFDIEKHSAAPIPHLARLLHEIPSARLFDEVLKLFLAGNAEHTFELLLEYNLFAPLFPAAAAAPTTSPTFHQRSPAPRNTVPPTTAVITPTGISIGASQVRPTQSALVISSAPANAEHSTGTPRWPLRYRAISGAARATRPTGPATATASAVSSTVVISVIRRMDLSCTPRPTATLSEKRIRSRR